MNIFLALRCELLRVPNLVEAGSLQEVVSTDHGNAVQILAVLLLRLRVTRLLIGARETFFYVRRPAH